MSLQSTSRRKKRSMFLASLVFLPACGSSSDADRPRSKPWANPVSTELRLEETGWVETVNLGYKSVLVNEERHFNLKPQVKYEHPKFNLKCEMPCEKYIKLNQETGQFVVHLKPDDPNELFLIFEVYQEDQLMVKFAVTIIKQSE